MIEVLERLGIQGIIYLNIIKAVYTKLIVNFNLNREKLKVIIPVKSGTREGCPLSPHPLKIQNLKS